MIPDVTHWGDLFYRACVDLNRGTAKPADEQSESRNVPSGGRASEVFYEFDEIKYPRE